MVSSGIPSPSAIIHSGSVPDFRSKTALFLKEKREIAIRRSNRKPSPISIECNSGLYAFIDRKPKLLRCILINAREEEGDSLILISMSAGGAFGGNRGARPVPPEKGVFPLDHMHLCDPEKKVYLRCLKESGNAYEKCRQFSKKYLECRMQKNLMAKQDMAELGFGEELSES